MRGATTLSDLFEEFLTSKTNAADKLAPDTLAIYSTHLRDSALPRLGPRTRPGDLTEQDIKAYLDRRAAIVAKRVA